MIHHNTIPSTQKASISKRYSQRSILPALINQTNKQQNYYSHLNSSFNRCYVEDFISLPRGTSINLLIPQKLVESMKKKKYSKGIDQKLMLVVDIMVPPLTQIGTSKDLYYIVEAMIALSPNQDASHTGINRQSIKAGLHGTQKYGSTLNIIGCNISPLIKWRDILNGCKDGIQVRYNSCLLIVFEFLTNNQIID